MSVPRIVVHRGPGGLPPTVLSRRLWLAWLVLLGMFPIYRLLPRPCHRCGRDPWLTDQALAMVVVPLLLAGLLACCLASCRALRQARRQGEASPWVALGLSLGWQVERPGRGGQRERRTRRVTMLAFAVGMLVAARVGIDLPRMLDHAQQEHAYRQMLIGIDRGDAAAALACFSQCRSDDGYPTSLDSYRARAAALVLEAFAELPEPTSDDRVNALHAHALRLSFSCSESAAACRQELDAAMAILESPDLWRRLVAQRTDQGMAVDPPWWISSDALEVAVEQVMESQRRAVGPVDEPAEDVDCRPVAWSGQVVTALAPAGWEAEVCEAAGHRPIASRRAR